jgi:hypothetical protein
VAFWAAQLIPTGMGNVRSTWVLKVFGWKVEPFPEFAQLAELNNDHGGFSVGDLDGDGRQEVSCVDHDYSVPGGSMAGGPFIERLYRWEDEGFREVDTHSFAASNTGSVDPFKDLKWHKGDRL